MCLDYFYFTLNSLYFLYLVTDFVGSIMKDESSEMISIHNIQYSFGDKIVLSIESSIQNIPMEEVTHTNHFI